MELSMSPEMSNFAANLMEYGNRRKNKAIEDKTLRGALGTELQNKSFETYDSGGKCDPV